MTEPTIDLTQWIKHMGRGCPVPESQPVQVMIRKGHYMKGEAKQWGPGWESDDDPYDIVAYRLDDVTELRQSDCVALDGLSDRQYQDLLTAFLAAGANYHETNNAIGGNNFLFWDAFNDMWVSPLRPATFQRQLTYQQVMDLSGKSLGCDPAYYGEGTAGPTKPMSLEDGQAWNRKSLPPVGTVCEYDDAEHGWVKTRILAHHPDGGAAWHESVEQDGFADGRSYSTDGPGHFRPIRSEERQAVDDMVNVLLAHHGHPDEAGSYVRLARALYRAGYRKQEAA